MYEYLNTNDQDCQAIQRHASLCGTVSRQKKRTNGEERTCRFLQWIKYQVDLKILSRNFMLALFMSVHRFQTNLHNFRSSVFRLMLVGDSAIVHIVIPNNLGPSAISLKWFSHAFSPVMLLISTQSLRQLLKKEKNTHLN